MRRNPVKVLFATFIILLGVVVPGRADQPLTKNPNYMNGRAQILEPGADPVIIAPTRDLVGATVRSGRANLYLGTADNSNIIYRPNSPVITSPKVQLIWYGTWIDSTSNTSPTAKNFQGFTTKFLYDLNNYLTKSNANPRWAMNNKYYQINPDNSKVYVPLTFDFQSSKVVPRYTGKYKEPLSQSAIYQIARDYIGSLINPDPSTIYVVLTSSDIKVNGFGTKFCGWHSYNQGNSMKYAFVGDPTSVSNCIPQTASPNKNPGADAMLSVLVHELEETMTDPQLNAWYDAKGKENADKCAWTWGSVNGDSTNGYYNLTLNGVPYLIQQGFALSTPSPSSPDTWSGICSMG